MKLYRTIGGHSGGFMTDFSEDEINEGLARCGVTLVYDGWERTDYIDADVDPLYARGYVDDLAVAVDGIEYNKYSRIVGDAAVNPEKYGIKR